MELLRSSLGVFTVPSAGPTRLRSYVIQRLEPARRGGTALGRTTGDPARAHAARVERRESSAAVADAAADERVARCAAAAAVTLGPDDGSGPGCASSSKPPTTTVSVSACRRVIAAPVAVHSVKRGRNAGGAAGTACAVDAHRVGGVGLDTVPSLLEWTPEDVTNLAACCHPGERSALQAAATKVGGFPLLQASNGAPP